MSRHSTPDPSAAGMPPSEPLAWLTARRAALAVSIAAAVVYLITMNRTFGFVDKGELVAVASTAGIAHPTGYPTIMLLGYLFAAIAPMRDVLALNALSAILTALGAGMLVLLFNDILSRLDRGGGERETGKAGKKSKGHRAGTTFAMAPGERAAIAGLAALFTAFTATWWNQGNGFEVYSLHAVMMPLATLLFLRWVDAEAAERDREAAEGTPSIGRVVAGSFRFGRGHVFALLLGLSFTNHLTTVLLGPGFLLYYFASLHRSRLGVMPALARNTARLVGLVPWFVLGLTPYAWLMIRAAGQPRFNWGDPSTLAALVDHVTGKIYQVYMNAPMQVFEQQTSYFFGNLPGELAYAGLALAAFGAFVVLVRNRWLGLLALALFATCILWSGRYDIMEIGPYYMTAIFAAGIWVAGALGWLGRRIGARNTILLAAALVALNLVANYRSSDESGNTLVEDMTRNVLDNLPKDAVILSAHWDFWVAGSFYMQGVEGYRPDVLVIDPELLRRRWYVDELTYTFPEFMGPVAKEVEAFKREVYKFDNDLPYDPATIQSAYIGMMNAMIDRHIDKRPMFVTGEVDPAVGARYVRTPNHMALRLTRDTAYVPQEFPRYRFGFWKDRVDGYTAKVYELYGRSAFARALYEAQHGRPDLAGRYLDLALGFDPGFDRQAVPDLQLNSEEQVYGMIDFFDQVRSAREQFKAQAAGK